MSYERSLCIAIRFDHGRFHATAWDQTANAGDGDWPPSPWRIARALLSVWHLRHPQLPEASVEAVINAMRRPPSFLLPPTSLPSQTRHYLPQANHLSQDRTDTTKTIDGFIVVDPTAELMVRWDDVDLSETDRHTAATLLESMPYFGRAESVCTARIVEQPPLDQSWIKPVPSGTRRLLCLTDATTRAELETSPTAMRKARRTNPAGSAWVAYEVPPRTMPVIEAPSYKPPVVTTLAWKLHTQAPFSGMFGVLATGALRVTRTKALDSAAGDGEPTHAEQLIIGEKPSRGDRRVTSGSPHEAAHWLWLENESGRVDRLILTVPAGVEASLLPNLLRSQSLPRYAHAPAGYVPGSLQFDGMGSVTEVLPHLSTPAGATRWRSVTPYLVGRHRIDMTNTDARLAEVAREIGFRSTADNPIPQLVGVRLIQNSGRSPREYRRYRWGQSMAEARPGYWLELDFAEPVAGRILALGHLAHFGFGLFQPN